MRGAICDGVDSQRALVDLTFAFLHCRVASTVDGKGPRPLSCRPHFETPFAAGEIMSRRDRIIAFTALLGGTLCFTAASAQTTASTQPVKPNPPPQICVNNQCSSTQNPPSGGGGGSTGSSHQIKWNP